MFALRTVLQPSLKMGAAFKEAIVKAVKARAAGVCLYNLTQEHS